MTDEVVDVASDPTALVEQCLPCQLTTGALEFDHEPLLAGDGAPNDPDEAHCDDPDAGRDLHRILNQSHEQRRSCGEQTEGGGRRDRPRPPRSCESKQADVEHDRLELSGALHDDHRDDDGEGGGGERHIPGECPQAPGDDRHSREPVIGWRRRLSDDRDEPERQREKRKYTAQVVGVEPTSPESSPHEPTVLLDPCCGLLLRAETRSPTRVATMSCVGHETSCVDLSRR